ncbi:MAG: transglutaminase-like domain-containing protein [archaeon]
MKKSVLILLFIILLTTVTAYEVNTEQQQVSMEISNKIKSSSSNLNINVFIYPRNDEKQTAIITTIPGGFIQEEYIKFKYNSGGDLQIKILSEITTNFLMKYITKDTLISVLKEETSQHKELEPYLEPSSYINFNDQYVISKSQQLNTGKAIETAFKIGEYLKENMDYDINISELKKASEIIQDKTGVCSHYSILFIALARANGIPARYISGIAYSNKEGTFREHAWVEIWINDWIPFDPTFGQFGWLDSSHIILKKSAFPDDPSIEYTYSGTITPGKIDIKTTINSESGSFRVPLDLTLNLFKEKVGMGSYVPLEIIVKNNNNFFVAIPIRVSLAPGIYGSNEKILLLEPGSSKKTSFIIEIPTLQKCSGGCYGDIEIVDSFGNIEKTKIYFSSEEAKISLEDAKLIADAGETNDETIDLFCRQKKDFFYDYENIEFDCVIENKGNGRELNICLDNQCSKEFFNEEEAKTIEFTANPDSSIKCIKLKYFESVIKQVCLNVNLLKEPELQVTTRDIIATYGDKVNSFLEVISNTNLTMEIIYEFDKYQFTNLVQISKGRVNIPFVLKTWKVGAGEKQGKATLKFSDLNEKAYSIEAPIKIMIKDVSFFEKLIIWFRTLFS